MTRVSRVVIEIVSRPVNRRSGGYAHGSCPLEAVAKPHRVAYVASKIADSIESYLCCEVCNLAFVSESYLGEAQRLRPLGDALDAPDCVYVCMYVCMYTCMYVDVCMCVYIIYIYIHTRNLYVKTHMQNPTE